MHGVQNNSFKITYIGNSKLHVHLFKTKNIFKKYDLRPFIKDDSSCLTADCTSVINNNLRQMQVRIRERKKEKSKW